MATEVIYDEAEPFQTYNPAPQEIYSNSGEFDIVEYSNSDVDNTEMSTAVGVQPLTGTTPDVADDRMSNSCSGTPTDGIKLLDEVVKEFEAKHEAAGNGESASRDVPVAWNVKLRNNWKRKLRRDAAAAAASSEQKYKKSDNRQTITGSLSRFFGKASHRLSLPNLNNLSIFKNDPAAVGDGNEIGDDERVAVNYDSDFDDDDDIDDCGWSDTEFDVYDPEPEPEPVMREENLYANIDDCITPSARCDVTGQAEPEVRRSTEEFPARDAAVTHHWRHRQRSGRSHAAPARHKTASESAVEQVLAGSGNDLRRKPPVAARPAALRTNPASNSASQHRRSSPPNTLNVDSVNVVDRPSPAGARESVEQVDVDQQERTNSCMSTSSDPDTSSGESATSGFSSGGSDVSKAAESTDENVTMTLGRPAKRQKPALKPKPHLNDSPITMTLNRRPMRPLANTSNQPATSDTQTASTPVPRPRPQVQPSSDTTLQTTAAPPVPLPRPFSPPANDTASGPALAAGVLSEPGITRQNAHVDDADDEGCESDLSYAKKPLPPVKTTRTGRMFTWHRSQSVENIPRDTVSEKPEPATSPQPKTPTNNKDGPGTLRLRGKAIMPDLSRFMRHRVTGDHKPKTARTKDQKTKETTAGAAVAKQLAMKLSSPEPADVAHKPAVTALSLTLPQLETQPWYFEAEDKYDCEQKVRAVGQDGAFVVRRRQADAGDGCPYALTLAFDGQIYHMLIRRRDNGKFSLGAERPDQHVFNSVVELVCFYANNAIHLTIDKNSGAVLGKVQLTATPTR